MITMKFDDLANSLAIQYKDSCVWPFIINAVLNIYHHIELVPQFLCLIFLFIDKNSLGKYSASKIV